MVGRSGRLPRETPKLWSHPTTQLSRLQPSSFANSAQSKPIDMSSPEPLFTPEPSLLGLRQLLAGRSPLPQNHTSSPAHSPTFQSPGPHESSPSSSESHGVLQDHVLQDADVGA